MMRWIRLYQLMIHGSRMMIMMLKCLAEKFSAHRLILLLLLLLLLGWPFRLRWWSARFRIRIFNSTRRVFITSGRMTFFSLFSSPILIPNFDLEMNCKLKLIKNFKNKMKGKKMSCNSLEFQRVLNVWLIKFFVLPLDTDVNRKSFPMRPAAIWRRPSGFV